MGLAGLGCLYEIVGWWLFFVVFALGQLHWIAGVAAGITGLLLLYYWKLSLTKHRCEVCDVVWSYDDVTGRGRKIDV